MAINTLIWIYSHIHSQVNRLHTPPKVTSFSFQPPLPGNKQPSDISSGKSPLLSLLVHRLFVKLTLLPPSERAHSLGLAHQWITGHLRD